MNECLNQMKGKSKCHFDFSIVMFMKMSVFELSSFLVPTTMTVIIYYSLEDDGSDKGEGEEEEMEEEEEFSDGSALSEKEISRVETISPSASE